MSIKLQEIANKAKEIGVLIQDVNPTQKGLISYLEFESEKTLKDIENLTNRLQNISELIKEIDNINSSEINPSFKGGFDEK